MFHRWAALLLVLALCAMTPKNAAGQTQSSAPRGQKSGAFGKPYPNPFNPEVHIPFVVDTVGGCTDGSRQNVVTLRISNILAQEVAVPILLGASSSSITSVPSSLVGQPLSNIKLGCGLYQAFWSGNLKGTNREAPSGPYLLQIFINGRLADSKQIYNRK